MAKSQEKIEGERKWISYLIFAFYAFMFLLLIYNNYKLKESNENIVGLIKECTSEGGKVTGLTIGDNGYLIACEMQGYSIEVSNGEEFS